MVCGACMCVYEYNVCSKNKPHAQRIAFRLNCPAANTMATKQRYYMYYDSLEWFTLNGYRDTVHRLCPSAENHYSIKHFGTQTQYTTLFGIIISFFLHIEMLPSSFDYCFRLAHKPLAVCACVLDTWSCAVCTVHPSISLNEQFYC